jgi:23S rRNA (cytidine1920-2'-O)/16S rRNA (cytidine1409-2'-O)-methyltransferase
VESRERAQALIMAGRVSANGQRVTKPGASFPPHVSVSLEEQAPYVSRGGLKLAHALDRLHIDPSGLTALDVGASTGGFTDCLLQRGAKRVYAVDVGYGQLHHRLRQDPRVVSMERVNARYPLELPQAVDLITLDVSFISLTLVIPAVLSHLKDRSYLVALVKPQFEAGREEVGRGGVIRDPKVHAGVLGRMIVWSVGQGLRVRDLCASPIQGDAGNREFFLLLQKPPDELPGPSMGSDGAKGMAGN